jgi:hypothetical protein
MEAGRNRLEYFNMLKQANFVQTEEQLMSMSQDEFCQIVEIASMNSLEEVQVQGPIVDQVVLSEPTEAERIVTLKVPKNAVDVKAALAEGARVADEIVRAYAADCLSKVCDSNIVNKYF